MGKPTEYHARPVGDRFEIVRFAYGNRGRQPVRICTVDGDAGDLRATSLASSYSQPVGEVNGVTVSRGELVEAFALVEPCDGWKNPIRGTVCDYQLAALPGASSASDGLERVREAVRFLTGSELRVLSSPASGVWNVEAAGYYAAVGA